MPVDIASVSYVLSSVASVGRIIETVLGLHDRGHEVTPAELQEIEAREQAVPTAAPAAFREELATQMTGPVVEALRNEMERIVQSMGRAVSDTTITAHAGPQY